jgi:hypothetical protein
MHNLNILSITLQEEISLIAFMSDNYQQEYYHTKLKSKPNKK